MTTLIVYAHTNDGFITCSSSVSYATARDGGGSFSKGSSGTSCFAQNNLAGATYAVTQSFTPFDTSALTNLATVYTAALSLFWQGTATNNTDMEALFYDQGSAILANAAFITSSEYGSFTRVATGTGGSSSQYYDFNSDETFVGRVNKTGYTRVAVLHALTASNTTPTVTNAWSWYSADQTGTTQDPKLTIEYSTDMPSAGIKLARRMRSGWAG